MKYEQIEKAIIKGFNSNIKKSKGNEVSIYFGIYDDRIQLDGYTTIEIEGQKKDFDIEKYDTDIVGLFEGYLNNKKGNYSLYDVIDYIATYSGYITVGDGSYSREFTKATDLNEIAESYC